MCQTKCQVICQRKYRTITNYYVPNKMSGYMTEQMLTWMSKKMSEYVSDKMSDCDYIVHIFHQRKLVSCCQVYAGIVSSVVFHGIYYMEWHFKLACLKWVLSLPGSFCQRSRLARLAGLRHDLSKKDHSKQSNLRFLAWWLHLMQSRGRRAAGWLACFHQEHASIRNSVSIRNTFHNARP